MRQSRLQGDTEMGLRMLGQPEKSASAGNYRGLPWFKRKPLPWPHPLAQPRLCGL